ncbi:MAG TPA: VOC family protein [Alphaproteobacteria bacterium]|jgi:catechol 2,3-dioxygenase-like lactoylglutathione lyase family enzyme|nr:VOC family protein [Alphaproteobacteria bacterium]
MLQKTPPSLNTKIKGISHVVVDVESLDVAEKFYDALGFASVGHDQWPVAGAAPSATLEAGAGQYVVLAKGPARNDPRISAAHTAYALPKGARDNLVETLTTKGVAVHRFREDRPSEAGDNVYIDDPSGNRIQLVARDGAPALSIDHAGLETNNILWSREFYQTWLGLPVEHRVGWKTDDYLAAKSLGEKGMEAAMPGSRYWNERYSQFETEKKALRPCPQLYFTVGGTSLAVYLASRQYQAPRDDVLSGTPCLGLSTTDEGLKQMAGFLREQERAIEGPVTHAKGPIAASLSVKDPGANFLEFCVLR